jgi:hypothetical protein
MQEYQQLTMPTAEELIQQVGRRPRASGSVRAVQRSARASSLGGRPQDFLNNCAVKSVISLVMGGVLGGGFGIFVASMDNSRGVSRMPSQSHFCQSCVVLSGALNPVSHR